MIHMSHQFYDCATYLNNQEMKQIQKAVRKIMQQPNDVGLRRHPLKRIASADVVSYSANKDIRIITFEPDTQNIYFLHAHHHDKAYHWAKTHAISLDSVGQSLMVSATEVQELTPPQADRTPEPKDEKKLEDHLPMRVNEIPYFFDPFTDTELEEKGVSTELLPLFRRIRDQDDVVSLIDKLPLAPAEELFQLADTMLSQEEAVKDDIVAEEQPFYYESVANEEQLDTLEKAYFDALQEPFTKWHLFLHPKQRRAVNKNSGGATLITGAAGTGKTVVGIHRCLFLLKKGFQRIHLLTFNRALCHNLRVVSSPLFEEQERNAVVVNTFHQFVKMRLQECGHAIPRPLYTASSFLGNASKHHPSPFGDGSWDEAAFEFIMREIDQVIAPQLITSLAAYSRAARRNSGVMLTITQKENVWKLFEHAWEDAQKQCAIPERYLSFYALNKNIPPLTDHALVVDETQDLGPCDLKFLAQQAPEGNQLTLLEDTKQRIYASPYRLKQLGIHVSGRRSEKLIINYRTTKEIGLAAQKSFLEPVAWSELPLALRDGIKPVVKRFRSRNDEFAYIARNVAICLEKKQDPIAILARTNDAIKKIADALIEHQIDVTFIDRDMEEAPRDGVMVATMHTSKGFEFKTVFVAGLFYGEDGIQVPTHLEGDSVAVTQFKQKERNLLYVAISRARDQLFLTGTGKMVEVFS